VEVSIGSGTAMVVCIKFPGGGGGGGREKKKNEKKEHCYY